MTSFSIQSFGCRVNQAEAFTWADELQKNGLHYIEDTVKSDLVIVNTCTLTQRADRDVRSFILRVSKRNPDSRLILTGCYAERDPGDLKQDPKVWRVFSNSQKDEMVAEIISTFQKEDRCPQKYYRSRALVKIQDGCDLACHFCVIPQVRGKSVSRSVTDILAEVKNLVEDGFEEIVLTGIHLCLFGKDQDQESSLSGLLQSLEEIKALKRIRLSSLDPRFMEEPLLEHLLSSAKICPHFHISLQHGSDRILKKMGRNIGTDEILSLLSRMRQNIPLASLGADVIVGYPEETEADFDQMRSFLEKSPLNYFHVFSFSPRPGTKATEKTQVDEKVKKKRSSVLRALSEKKKKDFQKRCLGKTLDAVVVKKEENGARVLTGNYLDVFVPGCSTETRKILNIRITRVEDRRLLGEPVRER